VLSSAPSQPGGLKPAAWPDMSLPGLKSGASGASRSVLLNGRAPRNGANGLCVLAVMLGMLSMEWHRNARSHDRRTQRRISV